MIDESVCRLVCSDGFDHVEKGSGGGETPVVDRDSRGRGVVPFGNETALDVLHAVGATMCVSTAGIAQSYRVSSADQK